MNTYLTIDNNNFLGEIKAISWEDAEYKIKDFPDLKIKGKIIETIDEFTNERVSYENLN